MKRFGNYLIDHIGSVAPAVAMLACLCSADLARAQDRYAYSADGAEVTDTQTSLIWRRCSEGQAWSAGTCIGTATTFSHEQALALAKIQNGWRLPNVKELFSLIDDNKSDPAIDTTVFPATASHFYWSSTPYAGDSTYAWSVLFYNGQVIDSYGYNGSRQASYYVRLVRQ